MKKMLQLVLFKENYTEDKDGKKITYDRYFVSEPDGNLKMNASLNKAFLKKLENIDIEFPLLLTLTDKENDYHFEKDRFDYPNEEIEGIYMIVINDAREIVHYDKD